ncbi:MAG: right-handed parallel beta-helix repeat-containing protein [Polyangiaceae bacterium]|nr:right-handed parallel beta-helix repeat-containing protein [Polyangiaceae bacterium]
MGVRSLALCCLALSSLACGSGDDSSGSAAGGTGGTSVAGGGSGGAGGSAGSAGGPASGGGAGSPGCEPFGRWPAPEITFTLPAEPGKGAYYPDVQKSFPQVDWSKLDRLYIPAGTYPQMALGNLPTRDAKRPLVITNQGGQVRVGPPEKGANYLWTLGGGSNWVLTGRHDPVAKTGDAAFVGHRCGAYATSRSHYGFVSDDAYAKGTYLHMGISVGQATDFELEFLEITRSGFAGIRLLNKLESGQPALPMSNVRVHDTYVHDTDGEGIYFGWTGSPPSNLMSGLKVYNNRFVRTGNEALQVQDLGDETEIHDNVIAFAALHWRDNGLGKYQDGNSQIATRQGKITIRNNVFYGGAGVLLSFWSQPQAGDGERQVRFENNFFGDSRNLLAYFGGSSTGASSFVFKGNFFRPGAFSYSGVDPGAKPPSALFGFGSDIAGPVTFEGNQWEGTAKLVASSKAVESGNVSGPLPAIEFVDDGLPPGATPEGLEAWVAATTLAPGSPARSYAAGDWVMYDAQLYECTKPSTNEPPPDHPGSWKKHPLPVDDFRVLPGSSYEKLGVR